MDAFMASVYHELAKIAVGIAVFAVTVIGFTVISLWSQGYFSRKKKS